MAADGLWETPKKKIVASSWDLGCATIEEVAAQADLFDETGLDADHTLPQLAGTGTVEVEKWGGKSGLLLLFK